MARVKQLNNSQPHQIRFTFPKKYKMEGAINQVEVSVGTLWYYHVEFMKI